MEVVAEGKYIFRFRKVKGWMIPPRWPIFITQFSSGLVMFRGSHIATF